MKKIFSGGFDSFKNRYTVIKKTVSRHPLKDPAAARRDLAYWLQKSVEERISEVQRLRDQHYGKRERLQRVAHVTKLSSLRE
jgi:hypothetical protein